MTQIAENSLYFIEFVKKTCLQNDIIFNLVDEQRVKHRNDIDCNGFFYQFPTPILTVAFKKPEHEWIPILVHEFCHLCQYLEQSTVWTNQIINGQYALDLLMQWCDNNNKEHKSNNDVEDQISPFYLAQISREVERDCEIRAVDCIQLFSLHECCNHPIDITTYIKKANSYLYFYTTIPLTKKWYDTPPYEIESLWSKMPSEFLPSESYDQLPVFYLDELNRGYLMAKKD